MIRRHWPALSIAAAVLAAGLNLQAQPPATPAPADPKAATPPAGADVTLKDVIARQQELDRRYRAFTTNLLALAQKLEKSDRIEDKDKAKALRKAIDLADKEGVDNKFTKLLSTLSSHAGNPSLAEITNASGQNDDLIKVMKEILAILQSDDELARLKAEIEVLQKLLADLNGIIRGEKILDSRANSGKGDPKQLAKDQGKLKTQTSNLADKMGSPKGAGDNKGEANGDAKPGKQHDKEQGENKEDTDKPKGDDRAKANMGDPMKGDGADGKPSKGGPPSDGGKPSKGSPMDGAGSASKPMGDPM